MNAADRYVANQLATAFEFSIKLRGRKEPFTLYLRNTLTTLAALKLKIEDMYALKFGKEIKIHKIAYYESYISLAGDSVGFDDAEKKYHWKELDSDDYVHYMFNTIEADPAPYHMYATLIL
ncbi:hypothetical protein A2U01_0011126 [Trifolium medium]|uniref:Uncharacterized protein n=1 Tax=Trifolium medium TaxID=97028 RepID=A0A392MT63_9FABA|nr:hypothetical protein [Trifolium medium]